MITPAEMQLGIFYCLAIQKSHLSLHGLIRRVETLEEK